MSTAPGTCADGGSPSRLHALVVYDEPPLGASGERVRRGGFAGLRVRRCSGSPASAARTTPASRRRSRRPPAVACPPRRRQPPLIGIRGDTPRPVQRCAQCVELMKLARFGLQAWAAVRHHPPHMVRLPCMRVACALAAIGALLVISACGAPADPIGDAAEDVGPEHVHGLGLNPADGSLYVATHTGMFRMPPGSQEAKRVGDHLQDTMGFAVVGPDRFLGSGHPDLRDDLPPLLGLIESSDAGRSWESVSLLGNADFHALRVDGPQVVGYDASGGRLMVSSDRGRTWRSSSPPAAFADVVVDPANPRRLVAASADGLMTSFRCRSELVSPCRSSDRSRLARGGGPLLVRGRRSGQSECGRR